MQCQNCEYFVDSELVDAEDYCCFYKKYFIAPDYNRPHWCLLRKEVTNELLQDSE